MVKKIAAILLVLNTCLVSNGAENKINSDKELQSSEYIPFDIQERLKILDSQESEYRKLDSTQKLNGRNITVGGYFVGGGLLLASFLVKDNQQRETMQIAGTVLVGGTSIGGAAIGWSDDYKYLYIHDEKKALYAMIEKRNESLNPPFKTATVFLSNPINK